MALLLMNPIAGNSEDWVAAFDQHLPGLDIRTWPDVGDLTDIEYLAMGRPELDKLPELSNLKLMLTMLASVDGMLANPKLPDVPLVKGEPEGGDPSLTEYAVTLILSHHRQMPAYRQQQREHVWQPIPQKGASEQRVGFMGYGVMAKPVAGLLAKMGFDVAAWTRTPKPDAPIEMFHGDDGFDDFLARTDIAICLLPVTPHTKGILNASAFSKMPQGASIISLGRGVHVVTDDMIAALESGQLSAATLDVTDPEPLPADSPLWDHPKVTIMPHVARRPPVSQIAPQFAENIKRFQKGEPLLQEIDRKAGY